MASKQQETTISPVLFMSVEGEPMSFFLRPGPVKRMLQPLITAGGGVLCNQQKPKVILLIDPKEKNSVPGSSLCRYVSTQYIHDCIEKEEQLDLEDYRLKPEDAQKQSPPLNTSREGTSNRLSGRVPYTSEEDEAILTYVSKRQKECGGNIIWKEMEKKGITTHSWQSMKFRYSNKLSQKQKETVDVIVEENNKAAEEMEIDAQSTLSESKSLNPLREDDKKNQRMNEESDESSQSESLKAETSQSPQTREPLTDAPMETQPETVDTTESQKATSEENSQSEEGAIAKSSKKRKKKQKTSEKLDEPRRLMTRRQRQLASSKASTLRCGKKLRSSSFTKLYNSLKKTKLAVRSAQKKKADQLPAKRARGAAEEALVENQGQSEQSEAPVANEKPAKADNRNGAPKEVENKVMKPLGLIHMATMEFEVLESEDNATEDLPTGPVTRAPDASDVITAPTADPETEHDKCDNLQQSVASCTNRVPDAISSEPSVTEQSVPKPAPGPSKAHLFVFDTESQEENSQVVASNSSAAPSDPQPTRCRDAAPSLTQLQLEENKLRIKNLMKQTNQDLASVTKALMKASGDFLLAFDLLVNSTKIFPLWNSRDDNLLLSGDPAARKQLQQKYGEHSVAKRMVYLEVNE